jgi:hypothetical protein
MNIRVTFVAEIIFAQFLQLLTNRFYRCACAVFGRNAQFFGNFFHSTSSLLDLGCAEHS